MISFDSVDGGMITLKMGGEQIEVLEKSQFYGDTCREMEAFRGRMGRNYV